MDGLLVSTRATRRCRIISWCCSESREREILPLAEVRSSLLRDGQTLFFTRWRKQPSYTSAIRAAAQNIWAYDGSEKPSR